MEEYLSLYDFLGHPAGPELGAKVASAAKFSNVKILTKEIFNPRYQGIIMTYPQSFLEDYFSPFPFLEGKIIESNENDLPF